MRCYGLRFSTKCFSCFAFHFRRVPIADVRVQQFVPVLQPETIAVPVLLEDQLNPLQLDQQLGLKDN
eukprot:3187482-Rhodomonas_salina.2